MQRVDNPVPRVRHPDWLHKKVLEKEDTHKQSKLDVLFAGMAARNSSKAAAVIDLEDFGGGSGSGGGHGGSLLVGIASTVEAIATPAADTIIIESTTTTDNNSGPPAMKETPPRHESFSKWLDAKKQVWRRTRLERKRRREAAGGADGRRVRHRGGGGGVPIAAAAATGVDGLFQQQADAAAGAAWQIVALVPSPTHPLGVHKAWTVMNGRMHAIPVRVPRTFYVDAVLGPDDPALAPLSRAAGAVVQLVRRTLPHGADAHFTYQVTLPESDYRAALPQLEAALSHPGVRGVYEARVAPEWSAALSTGCVAVVAPGARRRNLGAGFDLRELQARPVVQYGYFPTTQTGPALRHMLLHHSEDAARGRGLYALHLPADGVCHVWVVNPARAGQREVTGAVMDRAWNEAREALSLELQRREAEEEPVELPEAPRCEVVYVRSTEAAVKALRRLLTRIK